MTFVHAAVSHGLEHWLASPEAKAIAPALRETLRRVAAGLDPAQCAPASPAVLADTLASLALLEADGDSLAAALLFELPGLAAAVEAALPQRHAAVAVLLEGQRAANQVWTLHAERPAAGNTEGLRRLLLAIVRDLRVVPILLARQLARMRAAGALPEAERQALARLTRDIHAPLANRLGIWQLKWELEDLASRYLQPQVYKQIATQLDEKRLGRERYIGAVTDALRASLGEHGSAAEVRGRPKDIYTTWRKMQRKQLGFDARCERRAVRIAVDDGAACCAALCIVHALWVPIRSEFDDYSA